MNLETIQVIEQLNRDFGTPPAIPVLTHSHTTSVDTATVQLLSHTSTPFRPFTDAANPGSPFGPPHLSGHQLPCSPDGPLRKQEGEVETKGVWDGQRSNQMLSSRIGGRVVWGGSDGYVFLIVCTCVKLTNSRFPLDTDGISEVCATWSFRLMGTNSPVLSGSFF